MLCHSSQSISSTYDPSALSSPALHFVLLTADSPYWQWWRYWNRENTAYCIRKNNCDWVLNAIFEKLIFSHLLYIAFIFHKVCSSLQKLQDHNFCSYIYFSTGLFAFICLAFIFTHTISKNEFESLLWNKCNIAPATTSWKMNLP